MTGGQLALALISALLGAGVLGYARELIKWLVARRKNRKTPAQVEATEAAEKVHQAVIQADESLIVVARARDILYQDNAALRAERVEQDRRHALDRAEWARERAELRAELDAVDARLRAALDEVAVLRTRHGFDTPGEG